MSTLYIVATPIGNLEDITFRAVDTLKEVDIVFAEDTRVSRVLLDRFEIKGKPLESINARTEKGKAKKVLEHLEKGENVAFVTDAGTPGISDPGSLLARTVRNAGFKVVPIPGASAVVTALSASGLPSSEFIFLGFLPHKKGREKLFQEIADAKRTVVFFESPHRIIKTLERLSELVGENKKLVIAREITKIHEEFVEGFPQEILDHYQKNPDAVRGEFVVMVSSRG